MPDAAIAGGILGCAAGLAIAGVVVGVGVPYGPALGAWWNLVFVAVWLLGGGALATWSWKSTGMRFEQDRLVIRRPTGIRKTIPWDHIQSVAISTSTDEDDKVVARWLTLKILRHPDRPVPDMPTVFGPWREWNKEHFRTVRTGVALPKTPKDARNKFGEQRLRTRRAVIAELEARGFEVAE